MLRISSDEDRSGALRARALWRCPGGLCFAIRWRRRGEAASTSSAMSEKIKPSGARRYEEGTEDEAHNAASVQRGDEQQREADADEGDRKDDDRDSVKPSHEASAEGAAVPRRHRRRREQRASDSRRWARARSAPARFASGEVRSTSPDIMRLRARRRPSRDRAHASGRSPSCRRRPAHVRVCAGTSP